MKQAPVPTIKAQPAVAPSPTPTAPPPSAATPPKSETASRPDIPFVNALKPHEKSKRCVTNGRIVKAFGLTQLTGNGFSIVEFTIMEDRVIVVERDTESLREIKAEKIADMLLSGRPLNDDEPGEPLE
jgi:hypothetical protein